MMGNVLERFFDLEGIANAIFFRAKQSTGTKPEYHKQNQEPAALKTVPESDKSFISCLMKTLSDQSNPAGQITAANEIQLSLFLYKQHDYDTTKIEEEYNLRKRGLPYMRPHIEPSK